MSAPAFSLSSTVLGTSDPPGLASFYRDLLGWEVRDDEPEWVVLKPHGSATISSFQPQDDVRVLLDPAGHPFCLFESTTTWKRAP